MIIRKLNSNEVSNALELVWKVFMEYEAPDYSQDGITEFKKSINDPKYLAMLQIYGAFDEQQLVGVIATRNNGSHIALFFVDGKYQGKSIGRELFSLAYKENTTGKLTVNSSPYAIPIYHHLGFVDTEKEQITNGLRYTPMEYIWADKKLETKRLILRSWVEEDAKSLYKYASNPEVGPIAGWPVHTSVENSRDIIKNVLAVKETYAVVLKETTEVVGSVGLMIGDKSNIGIADDEGEIGYWIGVPFWGQGLIPEAVRELIRHGFLDMGLKKIWCGYFEGNIKSKRTQEKCGFQFHHIEKDKSWPLMKDVRTEYITCLTKEQWENRQ